MIFKVGHYYKHTTGRALHVVHEAELDTKPSPCLIAETDDGELVTVGIGEEFTMNWEEITYDEWNKMPKTYCARPITHTDPIPSFGLNEALQVIRDECRKHDRTDNYCKSCPLRSEHDDAKCAVKETTPDKWKLKTDEDNDNRLFK